MFPFKKKKGPIVLKGFVSFEAYYPEVSVFKINDGFCKAYKLEDPACADRESYVKTIMSYIKVPNGGSVQFCHLDGMDVMVVVSKADTPEAAMSEFEGMTFPLPELSISEWVSLISKTAIFKAFEHEDMIGAVNQKGKPAGSIIQYLQPKSTEATGKGVKKDNRFLEIEGKYVQTVVFTSFPTYIYASFLTEVIRISPDVKTSLHIRCVDKEKCMKAIEKLKVKLSDARLNGMKEALMSDEPLYHTQLLVSMSGDTKEEVNRVMELIRGVAERYLISMNFLEYQQTQAYKSVLPLGCMYVRNCRVLTEEQLLGLLPLSWMRHVANGVCYGRDINTGTHIFYNRLMTRESGFMLGSDPEFIQDRIISEIEQVRKMKPDACISIFTTNPRTCEKLVRKYGCESAEFPMLCRNGAIDREILRLITVSVCGNNGDLSREKKSIMESVLSGSVSTYERYVTEISGKNTHMGKQLAGLLEASNVPVSGMQEGGVKVFLCGGRQAKYVQRVVALINSALRTGADMAYIVSAEGIAGSPLIRSIPKMKKATIWTMTSLTENGEGLRRLYLEPQSKDAIYKADFLDISRHETADRVRLRGILEFDRSENAILSAKESGSGLMMTKEASYIYKAEEEEEKIDG